MNYEAIAENIDTMTETEKLNLITLIVKSLKNSSTPKKGNDLIFPHIDKNIPISQTTMNLVVGKIPESFDIEKATDEMWKGFAQ